VDTAEALRLVLKLHDKLTKRREEIETFESYFRGDQPLAYASQAWSREHAARYAGFADNWCGIVGGAAAERTELSGIRLGDDTGVPLDDNERQLWRDWDLNEMPLQSAQGFLTSSIARRSAVIVWGDDNAEPVASWEHPSQVVVDYEPGNRMRPRYALKAWAEDEFEFATLYTDDEVWKWQRRISHAYTASGVTPTGLYLPGVLSPSSMGWEPRENTGDDTWPIDNPLGEMPVREFEHKPMLRGEPLSRIAGTIAMQDAINMLWAYLFVAADHASMPARVVMGQEPPKLPILDENGQKIGEKTVDIQELSRGRMLWLTGQNAKIDSWESAKLDVFTQVINVAVKHTASQTKTPIHYIVGDLGNVNGETLKATETPLASDVRNDHNFYKPPLRGVFRLMALVRGNTEVAEACRTATLQWKNPETANEAQLADAALKDRQVGFPLEWVAQERYGLSQTQIDRLMDMISRDPAGTGALSGILAPFTAGEVVDDGAATA
jgi:hypothetical protein